MLQDAIQKGIYPGRRLPASVTERYPKGHSKRQRHKVILRHIPGQGGDDRGVNVHASY